MKTRCAGIIGFLFGHQFAIEVVKGPIDMTGITKFSLSDPKCGDMLRPIHETVIYCKRCGCRPAKEDQA